MSSLLHRVSGLQKVYREFDLDGGGDVGAEEMLELGQARRKLGQKSGEWTEEKNMKMMKEMGMDDAGNVSMENFVDFFVTKLQMSDREFDKNMDQFMACAQALKKKKIKREAEEKDKILSEVAVVRKEEKCEEAKETPAVEEAPVEEAVEEEAPVEEAAEEEAPVEEAVEEETPVQDPRRTDLESVYELFDFDAGGSVGAEEMLALGKARRKLGQQKGEWNKYKNDKLMREMGMDEAGHISMDLFVTFFLAKLPPGDGEEFKAQIKIFQGCAEALKEKKLLGGEEVEDAPLVSKEPSKSPSTTSSNRWHLGWTAVHNVLVNQKMLRDCGSYGAFRCLIEDSGSPEKGVSTRFQADGDIEYVSLVEAAEGVLAYKNKHEGGAREEDEVWVLRARQVEDAMLRSSQGEDDQDEEISFSDTTSVADQAVPSTDRQLEATEGENAVTEGEGEGEATEEGGEITTSEELNAEVGIDSSQVKVGIDSSQVKVGIDSSQVKVGIDSSQVKVELPKLQLKASPTGLERLNLLKNQIKRPNKKKNEQEEQEFSLPQLSAPSSKVSTPRLSPPSSVSSTPKLSPQKSSPVPPRLPEPSKQPDLSPEQRLVKIKSKTKKFAGQCLSSLKELTTKEGFHQEMTILRTLEITISKRTPLSIIDTQLDKATSELNQRQPKGDDNTKGKVASFTNETLALAGQARESKLVATISECLDKLREVHAELKKWIATNPQLAKNTERFAEEPMMGASGSQRSSMATTTTTAGYPEEEREERLSLLKKLFTAFDLDESGAIEPAELLVLGQARRRARQWTEAKNRKFFDAMDINSNGKVELFEFVRHLNMALGEMPLTDFKATLKALHECVRDVKAEALNTMLKTAQDEMEKQKVRTRTPPKAKDESMKKVKEVEKPKSRLEGLVDAELAKKPSPSPSRSPDSPNRRDYKDDSRFDLPKKKTTSQEHTIRFNSKAVEKDTRFDVPTKRSSSPPAKSKIQKEQEKIDTRFDLPKKKSPTKKVEEDRRFDLPKKSASPKRQREKKEDDNVTPAQERMLARYQ